MKISHILKSPSVTEKTTAFAQNNKYVFNVSLTATKGAIKKEISDLYKVDVLDIQTLILPGKQKRVARSRKYSKSSKHKKAIVTLKAGQKISLFETKE